MRLILAAFIAVFAVSLVTTVPGFSQQQPPQQQQQQQQQRQQQTTGFSARPSPIHSFAESDFHDERMGLRDFIINCMQGRQQ
jgi:hypothetical protein